MGGGDDSVAAADEEFYFNLEIMQNLFPHYDRTELTTFLQQCNGSLEQAVELLEL